MYFECASPDLALTATPASVRPDEQAALAATLSCGGQPMAGRALEFDVSSGPGDAAPPGDTTGEDGVARSAFHATEAGVATIEAVDLACRAFAPRTVAASATVTVADAPARWTATIASRAVVEEHADGELVWDARVSGALPFRSGDPACAAEVAARFALSGEYDVCGGGVLAASSTLEGYSYDGESCDDVQLAVGPAEVYLFGAELPGSAALVTFLLTTEQVCSYVVRCCVVDYCTDASGAEACTNQDGTCHGASCCRDRGPDDLRNERHCGVDEAIHAMRDSVWTPSPYLEVNLAEGATRSATMPAELGFRPGSPWTLRIDRAP